MQEFKLCKDCRYFYPFGSGATGVPDARHITPLCYHPQSVSEIDMVHGYKQFTLAIEMRRVGKCKTEALLFEEKPVVYLAPVVQPEPNKPISFWKRLFK
jgi:hypothetical protein